jgi:small-conductance mechanosensitive channel
MLAAHVRLVGLNAHVGQKLLYTVVLIAALIVIRWVARGVLRLLLRGGRHDNGRFWARQGINVASAVVLVLGLLSIWFDDPSRLATGIGLVSAGLAFALQKVVASLAGYVLILRGDIFTVGDRIVMGGVRGDVIGLGFLRTRILEMGQPVGDDSDVSVWVEARQYTGRIVTVANAAVFDEPVYNYSRDFPYLWEELHVPIRYDADRARAEQILLDAARRHTADLDERGEQALEQMQRRYFVPATDLQPDVFYKLTDNWLELAVRFIAPTHGVRQVKSDMSRDVLAAFEQAGIAIASSTYDIVGMPPLRFEPSSAPYPSEDRNGAAAVDSSSTTGSDGA